MQDQVDSLEKQTSEVVEKNYEEEHRLRREKGPTSQFYSIQPCILSTIFAYDVSSSNWDIFKLSALSARPGRKILIERDRLRSYKREREK